nr:helix-turn-helix domain-containing protein [Moraxella osloensis]
MTKVSQNKIGGKMDKSIIRTVKNAENPFVMIDRRIFENDGLSLKAKGLLGYLLSRPDNWTICMADLVKRTKDGKDSVNSALDELTESGYVVKTEQQRESGKFSTCEYVVYEQPVLKTRDGETDAEKPQRKNRDGKSATNNNDLNNKEYNESEKAPAQNSEIDLSLTEKPTAIETFEFLKQSLVFGSEFGVISEREPNLAEINALVTEVDCFWSNKHLTKKQLLGKILGSVNRLSVTDRLEKYTVTQNNATDVPVVENWDSRQGEQISDFVAPLPMKGFVR